MSPIENLLDSIDYVPIEFPRPPLCQGMRFPGRSFFPWIADFDVGPI